MNVDERVRLLESLAGGDTAIRDLAGLSKRDVDAMSRLGRVAFESGRFEHAATIFAGLEALESDHPEHSLRRAHAEVRAGRSNDAVASVTRYLENDRAQPAAEVVRALLLRASLLIERDRAAALLDIKAAHIIAEDSPSAMDALKAGGR